MTGCGPEAAVVSDEAAALHRESLVIDLHLDTLIAMRLVGYDISTRHTNRLYMHPEDAARAGLANGALADVSSETGTVRLPVELLPDLIGARVCMSLLHAAHGLSRDPGNTYLQISADPMWRLLDRLDDARPERLRAEVEAAVT